MPGPARRARGGCGAAARDLRVGRGLTFLAAGPIYAASATQGHFMKLAIPDMTCGHCKAVVERTIIDLDSEADVVVDLAAHTVEIATTAAPEAILTALKAEGYPARRIA